MPNINQAYQWAINTCNKSNVGYSQTYRNQQTVNGVTYYDCSSFIWYALLEGGFDCVKAYETALWGYTGNAVTTAYMEQWLLALGFKKLSVNSEWKAGDILLRDGHTEMVYSGRVTMGAHTDTVDLANQVSINGFSSSTSEWGSLFRYEVNTSYTWIKGNRYLSLSEMENNAKIVYSIFTNKGWSLNAIAGMLGNMQSESTINPGIWQSLTVGSGGGGGYGLVQWTPWTNYTDWADLNGYDWDNGDAQCKWIDEVTASVGQWKPTSSYPMKWSEFKVSTQSPETLAYTFLYNFERPASLDQPNRKTQARYWYDYLSGITPDPPNPPVIPTKRKKMPLYMMLRYY